MEEKKFSYKTTYAHSTTFWDDYKGQVPVVMNWTIRPYSCKDAKKNTNSYACVSNNSVCVDDGIDGSHSQAYRCKCLDGYDGNPYVKGDDGCKGIDSATPSPARYSFMQIKRPKHILIPQQVSLFPFQTSMNAKELQIHAGPVGVLAKIDRGASSVYVHKANRW